MCGRGKLEAYIVQITPEILMIIECKKVEVGNGGKVCVCAKMGVAASCLCRKKEKEETPEFPSSLSPVCIEEETKCACMSLRLCAPLSSKNGVSRVKRGEMEEDISIPSLWKMCGIGRGGSVPICPKGWRWFTTTPSLPGWWVPHWEAHASRMGTQQILLSPATRHTGHTPLAFLNFPLQTFLFLFGLKGKETMIEKGGGVIG